MSRNVTRTPSQQMLRRREHRQTVKFNANRFIKQHRKRLENEYEIGEMIGAGNFGEVYVCHHKLTGCERAVKVVEKSPFASENASVVNEFNILRQLDHPNILKIYELCEDDDHFYIITDIYGGGELFDRIATNGTLSEEEAAALMYNLLSCMNYCHKKNVIHRDLKPENLLQDDTLKLEDIKIIDFGISQIDYSIKACGCIGDEDDDDDNDDDSSGIVDAGSPAYMAPEMLDGCAGPKSDIWACGMIAFVILGGYTPYEGTEEEIMEQIAAGKVEFVYDVWDTVSDEAKEFIKFLLNPDLDERPCAEEALAHPWLLEHRDTTGTLRSSDLVFTEVARESLGSIHGFHADSKLKQAVCSFIASQLLSKSDKQEIDAVFRALDKDCNGNLDRSEVEQGFKQYFSTDLTKEQLDLIFSRVDVDDNGTIQYSEFLVASMWQRKLLDDDTLRAAFDLFDTDNTGEVDVEKMKKALGMGKNWDDYVTDKIIREVDTDGDGSFSFNDFKDSMNSSCSTCLESSFGSSNALQVCSEELKKPEEEEENKDDGKNNDNNHEKEEKSKRPTIRTKIEMGTKRLASRFGGFVTRVWRKETVPSSIKECCEQ